MPKNYDLFLKGGVGGWDFNSDYVNWVLDKHKDSEVQVLVNSLGGYLCDGVAISSLFKIHGNVHVHFVGHNASAATVAAMGAKRVTIDEDAAFLVHKCLYPVMEWAYMNADELDEHIKKLEAIKKDNETFDSCVAGMYARRCKKPKDDLLGLMKVGGWLTPEQALEWGFVDEITHYDEDEKTEITAAAITAMADAGIPLPPNVCKKKGSILERFFDFLQSPFSNLAPDIDAAKQSKTMTKLNALSALLGVTLAFSGNAMSLSEDQVTKIEDTLNENKKSIDDLKASVDQKTKDLETANSQIAALKAAIAEKDRTIAELKKEPASETTDVVDSNKDDDPYAPVSEDEALAVSRAFAAL